MPRTNKTPKRKAVTLIEATMSTGIVGAMLVASMNMLGASKLARKSTHEKFYGYHLAQELMEEILAQDYQDEAEGIDSFGRTTEEQNTGDRSLFNDVDDYTGWTEAPPMRRDGTVQTNLPDWTRTVAVAWVDASDRGTATGTNSGIKKIQVTVARGSNIVATLTAFKTFGLPNLEACCLADATCLNLSAWECANNGGTPNGTLSTCASMRCNTGISVLFVTSGKCLIPPGESELRCKTSEEEQQRIVLMESWGFQVEVVSVELDQPGLHNAAASADVAYVPTEIDGTILGTKLLEVPIGVVIEEMMIGFGVAEGWETKSSSVIRIINNTHQITESFALDELTILSSPQNLTKINANQAPGLQTLGELFNVGSQWKPSLAVIEPGGELTGGRTAAGRRVQLPWGGNSFDFLAVNADGQALMKRAIEWAADAGPQCGDSMCDSGEACTCLADCGAPPSSEASDQCEDTLDNDCDGNADCDDLDCSGSASCVAVAMCGNMICEAGEDCNTCGSDCSSKTTGKPSGLYCCGNGTLEAAEGGGSICDGNP